MWLMEYVFVKFPLSAGSTSVHRRSTHRSAANYSPEYGVDCAPPLYVIYCLQLAAYMFDGMPNPNHHHRSPCFGIMRDDSMCGFDNCMPGLAMATQHNLNLYYSQNII